jgi:hypothetical protein
MTKLRDYDVTVSYPDNHSKQPDVVQVPCKRSAKEAEEWAANLIRLGGPAMRCIFGPFTVKAKLRRPSHV